jgi:hypothetical protein
VKVTRVGRDLSPVKVSHRGDFCPRGCVRTQVTGKSLPVRATKAAVPDYLRIFPREVLSETHQNLPHIRNPGGRVMTLSRSACFGT